MKVNVSLDDDLMRRVDNFADENYMSRSGLISLACSTYLSTVEVSMLLKDMALAMRKIADEGKIDDDTRRQLEDFERLSKMLTGK